MTCGAIAPQLLLFAFPIMFGSLFNLVYSLADTYVVGHFVGDNALAAVSATGNASYFIFSFTAGINMGSSVVLAQAYGAKDEKLIRKVLGTSAIIQGICAVLLTVFGILLSGPVLRILQTPDDIFELSRTYMVIIYAGTLGSMFYNWLASTVRAFGNSFVPLLCLVFSGIMNIVLNLVFVLCFHMGIEGVAFATVLTQVLSGILCFAYAWKNFPVLHLRRDEWRVDMPIVKKILIIGIPAAIQNSIIAVSNMVLQGALNTYGTLMVLAYGIVSRYEMICMQVGDSLGAALATFVGQNMGAGKMDRVEKSVKSTLWLNLAGYAIVSPVVFVLASFCMSAFTSNIEAIEIGAGFIRTYAVFFPVLGILILFQSLFRSAGDVKATILMGACEVISRAAFAIGLSAALGGMGLRFVSPFTWTTSLILGLICYKSGKWRQKKLV